MPKNKRSVNAVNSTGPLILIAMGTVLILIVLILILFNSQIIESRASAGQPTLVSDIPYPDIARISLEDARSAFDAKTAVFVDVRTIESFQERRIPGAVSLPLDQLENQIPQLDPDAWYIPYCT